MRWTWAAVATATVLLTAVAPAAAQGPTPSGRSIVLLVDGSSGMSESLSDGTTRLDAVKQAVRVVLPGIPAHAQVGVRVAGAEPGCGADGPAVPAGQLNRAAIRARVDGLHPAGAAPLAAALRRARADLPAPDPGTVIVISGGESPCGPPPACTARAGGDPGTAVAVIGVRAAGPAARRLRCLARGEGGTYVDAHDARGLQAELRAAVARALRPAAPAGTPVQGAAWKTNATRVSPGRYLDVFAPDQERWYAVEVPDGERLYVAATAHPPDRLAGAANFEVEAFDAAGQRVGGVAGRLAGGDEAAGPVTSSSLATLAAGGPKGPRPGQWIVRVALTRATYRDPEVPVELGVAVAEPGRAPDLATAPMATPTPAGVLEAAARRDDGGSGLGLLALFAAVGVVLGGGFGFGAARWRAR